MTKAIFIDYYGTLVAEGGERMGAAVKRVIKNSDISDPALFMKLWWKYIKSAEASSRNGTYVSEDVLSLGALRFFEEEYGLKDDLEEILDMIRDFWENADLFPDARDLFEKCPLPVWVITNNPLRHCSKALAKHGLKPAGIITSDDVRSYKPNPEIFRKALEVSGVSADDVLYIGDSYESDYLGAMNVGIKTLIIDRKGKMTDRKEITIASLEDVLNLI